MQVPPGKTLLDIFLKGDWVADDKAKFECLDGPTPAPTSDSCLSGADCNGYSLTA